MNCLPYQNLIGGLLYLSISTRPDIFFAVSFLSQFNSCYNVSHWKAAKRVLRYLKGTRDYCSTYKKTGENLHGFVDADWGNVQGDRHSFSGYAFMMASSPISWEARKQRTVALSTTESEYMAICEATRESIYLKGLLLSIDFSINCMSLSIDCQSAQNLIRSHSTHLRTKHIDIRHYFIREKLDNKIIDLKYLSTDQMPADILTKGLTHHRHLNCVLGSGLLIV